jgi:hypothetical protein
VSAQISSQLQKLSQLSQAKEASNVAPTRLKELVDPNHLAAWRSLADPDRRSGMLRSLKIAESGPLAGLDPRRTGSQVREVLEKYGSLHQGKFSKVYVGPGRASVLKVPLDLTGEMGNIKPQEVRGLEAMYRLGVSPRTDWKQTSLSLETNRNLAHQSKAYVVQDMVQGWPLSRFMNRQNLSDDPTKAQRISEELVKLHAQINSNRWVNYDLHDANLRWNDASQTLKVVDNGGVVQFKGLSDVNNRPLPMPAFRKSMKELHTQLGLLKPQNVPGDVWLSHMRQTYFSNLRLSVKHPEKHPITKHAQALWPEIQLPK